MDPGVAQAALSLGVGLGLAAAAGLRVFVPLLVLGVASRLGWVPLADDFAWLASPTGLGALGVATVLEVGAYYVPWVDNVLDVAAGPLAIMAGVLATAAVTTDLPPELRWAAAVLAGGGAAGVVQGLTSFARLKSTAATGGAANPILATLELIGSVVTSLVAVVLPLLALLMSAGLLFVLVTIVRRVRRRPVTTQTS
jgi:hypothetical protein